jgi:hypothetical protein
VTRIAFINEWTVVCAFSYDEAGRYLETYRSYENKGADLIKERVADARGALFAAPRRTTARLTHARLPQTTARPLDARSSRSRPSTRRTWRRSPLRFRRLRS